MVNKSIEKTGLLALRALLFGDFDPLFVDLERI
jgi:hypothetical protein